MMARHGIQKTTVTIFTVSVVGILSAGCGTMGATSRGALNDDVHTPRLEVENHHWQEIRVYLIRGQSSRRLVGTVEAGATRVFELSFAEIGESVQVLLQPVGVRSATYLIPEPVTTGQRIVLRIANILNRSLVLVPGAV